MRVARALVAIIFSVGVLIRTGFIGSVNAQEFVYTATDTLNGGGWPSSSQQTNQVPGIPVTTLNLPERLYADNYEPPPQLTTGFATTAELAREYGNVHYELIDCNPNLPQVDVGITTSEFEYGSGLTRFAAELIRRAVIFAQERCVDGPWQVNWVTINHNGEQPNATYGLSLIGTGNDFQYTRMNDSSNNYYWTHLYHDVWGWMKIVPFGVIALILIAKWETFVRWYYILTPHPAADMVDAAVAGGAIDGKVFADLMRPVPGNRIERQVRTEQARRLETLARETEAQLRRRADEAKRKLQEEATFRAAQRDMHDATVDAQLAKARADLFEQLAESLRQSTEAK